MTLVEVSSLLPGLLEWMQLSRFSAFEPFNFAETYALMGPNAAQLKPVPHLGAKSPHAPQLKFQMLKF